MKCSHSMSPPLDVVRARLLSRSTVLDVEGEDFLRAGGGLVQQSSQVPLPDGDVLAAEQPLQEGLADGLDAVGFLRASLQAGAEVDLQSACGGSTR